VTWSLDTALVAAGWGAVSGWLLPRLVARLPEPEPDHEADEAEGAVDGIVPAANEADYSRPVDEPKELYADMAALPGLPWKLAAVTALASGVLGARLGWQPEVLFLLVLVPVGVALAMIDWRTRYLPTRLIWPAYAVTLVLVVVASALEGDWTTLLSALLGSAGAFAVFFVMWWIYPRGMAFGDVRLSALLGLGLGWLSGVQVVLGLYTGVLLGGVLGSVLALAKVFHRKHYPFGPFLLIGSYLAAVFPRELVHAYGWVVQGIVGLFT
jgi:leader peptidase (prepilin peptidase)/N-methyltransferase